VILGCNCIILASQEKETLKEQIVRHKPVAPFTLGKACALVCVGFNHALADTISQLSPAGGLRWPLAAPPSTLLMMKALRLSSATCCRQNCIPCQQLVRELDALGMTFCIRCRF
jgi:hypothetical protein